MVFRFSTLNWRQAPYVENFLQWRLSIVFRYCLSGLIVLLTGFTTGCREPGLERSNLAHWEYRELPRLGISLEIPTDYHYSGGDSTSEVAFLMHPLFPPRGLLAEPRCMFEVRIQRMTSDQFEEERLWAEEKAEQVDNDSSRKHWLWRGKTHPTIERFDQGGYANYGKDIVCRDGSVLMMSASVNQSGVSTYCGSQAMTCRMEVEIERDRMNAC